MSVRRFAFYLWPILLAAILIGFPVKSQYFKPKAQTLNQDSDIVVGRNVNMVSGKECIDGDPYLQRQNEPSIAVSTRNALHLLAGANDWRGVDMPISEGPLPGVPQGAAAGDAWLGVFKSFNGGESWISTLLHGHPKDTSPEGMNSPLHGFDAASDPTVRAGANGLFFYSGIVFDRVLRGRSAIFVARFIDNNVIPAGVSDSIFATRRISNNAVAAGVPDSTVELGATLIDEGTSGQFADKPWIAVDVPRNGSGTIPISTPNMPVQHVARFNVYMAYSIFLGSQGSAGQSKIMFVRSLDSGTTWEKPIKISESQFINQGTTIAVSPKDGKIYIAWRRFASQSETSTIMVSQSSDFGNSFTMAVTVKPSINAFDQYSAGNRFRTYAFPTIAVDDDGIVYAAWSELGWGPGGDARIVIATSTDGVTWGAPQAVDNHGGHGHQIMPSLSIAARRVRITYYDLRKSEGGFESDISDPGPTGLRHTMDVWVAQASPSATPAFTAIKQVSKYLHWVKTDSNGKVITPVEIVQVEKHRPNFTLFEGGLTPFVGDYIDIAPAPPFLFDQQAGGWRFNTELTDPATSFISWTDNRDVRPPPDGDWTTYTPPSQPCSSSYPCSSGDRTGMRNQNVYSSHITQGLMIGSPVNTKPLITYKRTFLVFAKNLTEGHKIVRLAIESPNGMQASFWEAGPPEDWEDPFLGGGETWVEVDIAPYSSVTMAVFVHPYPTDPYAPFRVKVEEINGTGDFVDYILLNPDPVNTQIIPVVEEYHTPDMMMDSPAEVNFTDPTVLSEGIVYVPFLEYIQENCNPDILTPAYRSPAYRSGNVVNPAYRSSAVGEIPDGKVTDLQWRVKNAGNTTSAYSFVPVGEPPALPEGGTYQLLIYRVSTTPASGAGLNPCELYEEEHHDLVLKVDTPAYRSPAYRSPAYRSPAYRSPAFRSPAYRSNTFSLAPGETAVCTIRIIEPNPSSGGGTILRSKTMRTMAASSVFNPEDYAKTIGGAAVSQALNPDGQVPFASSLFVVEQTLPGAWVNDPYVTAQLEAYGGTPVSIDNNGTPEDPNDDRGIYIWTPMPLQYPGTGSFSGLSVNADGSISGTLLYDPNVTYPAVISFMAEATDISTPPQKAQRMFQISVGLEYHTITATAGGGGSINPSGSVQVAHGTSATFAINPADCYHVADVLVDGISKGAITTYTFMDVRADHTIHATFAQDIFTITATASTGGTITPSGPVPVVCGNTQAFTIAANEGYLLEDVVVDGSSQGAVLSYTFYNVRSNHSITAKFRTLESWVRRYNNADVNGDDEAKAIAVHKPSGNVIVSGYSTGKTTGPDCYTISYNSDGLQNWSGRWDGPAHLGDYAMAVAVDSAGNTSGGGYYYRGMQVKHSDYVTIRYDISGKLLWDAQYDDRRNGNDEIRAIAVDGAGFVYVTGRSEDSLSKNDPKHYDYYTIKYNPNTGKVVWEQRYDNTSVLNAADEATALAVDQAGNVYVTGRSYGGATGFDFVTIKYNSSGAQQWVQRYNNSSRNGDDGATGIALDIGGNIVVTGRSQGSGTDFDFLTIKYDSSGALVWQARYNNSDMNGVDEAAAIGVDASNNIYVTGRSQGNSTGFDYVTIKYNLDGTQQWVRRYDNNINGTDEATALALDAAGNVYVTGRSQGSVTGLDYLTIKYDGFGNQVWRARYNNSNVNGADEAAAIGIDASNNVYVTGRSQGGTLGLDYATVKYKQ